MDERIRLTDRIRQQLWRYYPQALDLNDDMGADWVLDLLTLAPTPAAARRLTEKKVAEVLTTRRIRRLTAVDILSLFQVPALTVAGGTELAATAHIAAVAERLRLVNRQLKEVERNIDRLIASLPGEVTDPGEPLGQSSEQRDAVILRSFPGVGRSVLATLLAEANRSPIEIVFFVSSWNVPCVPPAAAGEEALDGVEPRRGSGCEVERDPFMAPEPLQHLGMCMGGIVVEDHVDGLPGGDLGFDLVEKADELLMSVALHAVADDRSIKHVERREQCRGPVALVVVRHRSAATLLQGPARWVRSSAWVCDFSSDDSTTAWSGGFM